MTIYLQDDQPFTCPVCGKRTSWRGKKMLVVGEWYDEEECSEHGIFLTVEDKEFTENDFSLDTL